MSKVRHKSLHVYERDNIYCFEKKDQRDCAQNQQEESTQKASSFIPLLNDSTDGEVITLAHSIIAIWKGITIRNTPIDHARSCLGRGGSTNTTTRYPGSVCLGHKKQNPQNTTAIPIINPITVMKQK